MSTSLTTVDPWPVAQHLARAKAMIPNHINSAEEAYAVILAGAEMGLPPMRSLRMFHFMQGKPVLSSEGMLAAAINAGVKLTWVHTDVSRAELKLMRTGHGDYTQHFSIEEAQRAGLLRNPTWQKYPAAMLRARAISAAVRAYCPDVLGGVYLPEEIESIGDVGGNQTAHVQHDEADSGATDRGQPQTPSTEQVERPAGQCECGPVCTREPHEQVGKASWRRLMARVGKAGMTYDDVKVVYQRLGRHLPKSYGTKHWDNLGARLEDPDGALAFRALLADLPLDDEPPMVETEAVPMTEDEQYEADEAAAKKEFS